MRLVPTYTPDADYIDRQLELETQPAANAAYSADRPTNVIDPQSAAPPAA